MSIEGIGHSESQVVNAFTGIELSQTNELLLPIHKLFRSARLFPRAAEPVGRSWTPTFSMNMPPTLINANPAPICLPMQLRLA